jgi:hypothetical protein
MMLPGMQGIGAGYIGAGLGAIEGLRTGSLKKGLMAGLGAYGGASIAGGLMGSGAMDAGSLADAKELQIAQTDAANKALGARAQQEAAQRAAELTAKIAQQQAEALANNSSKSFMENLSSNFSTAGKGLSNGFGNFSNSVGMVPGSIGLKTALGAAAIPAVMSAYDEGNENSGVPVQKTNDADLGAYAKSGAQFRPNWVGPYESKVRGGEYTYARPYYGAEGGAVGMADGGVTGMAMGGVPQRDAYQEYMDYYNNSFPPVSKEATTVAPFQYPEPTVAAPATPVATPFLETPVTNTPVRGGGGRPVKEPGFFDGMSDSDRARHYSYSPFASAIGQGINTAIKSPFSSVGLMSRLFMGSDEFDAKMDREMDIVKGYDPANVVPVMEGYTRVSPPDPFRRTVKEQDTYSNENSNTKIAGIIKEAQEAAARESFPTANTPPPGFTRAVAALPAGAGASNPTPQGDPAQVAQAAQDARIAAFDAGRSGGDRNSVTPGGGSSDASPATGDRGYGREGQHAAATGGLSTLHGFEHMARGGNVRGNLRPPAAFFQKGKFTTQPAKMYAEGGASDPYNLGSYSDGGRLLKGPGDGVSDSIPATIGKGQPARLADGEFVIPARIVSEIGNGSTEAGARKLYAMMDRIQAGRKKSVGRGKVAVNSRADRYLPA